jgi:hypothetical protein
MNSWSCGEGADASTKDGLKHASKHAVTRKAQDEPGDRKHGGKDHHRGPLARAAASTPNQQGNNNPHHGQEAKRNDVLRPTKPLADPRLTLG